MELRTPQGGERGLYCKTHVAAGEPLLAVPWNLCLVAEPSPDDASLISPWHTPLQPSCESRLAALLMETLNGCDEGESNDGDAARRARFWRQWRKLLPQASSLSHPIALPEELSHQLQHEELAAAGRAQVAFTPGCTASSEEGSPTCCVLRLCQAHRADVLLGECPCSAPGSDQSSCPESHWAMAMCSSRPFRMPAVAGHAEQVCHEMLHAPLAW